MLKWLTCILTFAAVAAPEKPFWKSKPKVYERVQNREVIVSVNTADGQGAKRHLLRLAGAGQVGAPCDFVYAEAQHYEQLAKFTGYVEKFKMNPDGRTLLVEVKAFGFSSEFKVLAAPKEEPHPKSILFTILDGPMQGFHFTMAFDPVKP